MSNEPDAVQYSVCGSGKENEQMAGGTIEDGKRKSVDNCVRRQRCIGSGVTRGTAGDSGIVWRISGGKGIKNKHRKVKGNEISEWGRKVERDGG